VETARSQLTGDWFGSQGQLAENGLSFFGDLNQYYQGLRTWSIDGPLTEESFP
jgi:hypothetical protein